jgi:hypothetical protein
LLESLQAAVAGQLAVLDDAELTGAGMSPAAVLGVAATELAAADRSSVGSDRRGPRAGRAPAWVVGAWQVARGGLDEIGVWARCSP